MEKNSLARGTLHACTLKNNACTQHAPRLHTHQKRNSALDITPVFSVVRVAWCVLRSLNQHRIAVTEEPVPSL
ncbi:MAG: hypothetical protein MI745_15985, partial [Pseudomonadales bacterium]|nr:hypothetical protein [Pseudomonadales bacterium]